MGETAMMPGRVFISYAHDDDPHIELVREFWLFLRGQGIDADLDLPAGEARQDWSLWMLRGVRDSRRVIVVASPAYKRRGEGDAAAGEGKGVHWESRLLRNLVYEDPGEALDTIVPVVLPGGSPADLPLWLGGSTHTHYPVKEFTVEGAESLLRLLTGQPYETVPPLGPVPVLPPRGQAAPPVPSPAAAFTPPDDRILLDALMDCPALRRLSSRHELLLLMGEFLGLGRAFEVPEDADARTHLRDLLRRVRRTRRTADAALKAMYLALEEIAPDDTGTEQVRELLVASGLVFGEA